MNKLTSNKIAYVSFLMAFSIIVHHAYNVNVYNLTGFFAQFEDTILIICEASVSLFFIISAFLFYYNLDETNILRKCKSRIFSLIIPYLAWNLIGYLYYQILSLFPALSQHFGGTIETFSLIGMFKAMIIGNYNLVTWFLRSLIIYTFLLPWIYKIYKTKIGSLLLLLISIFLGHFFGEYSDTLAYLTYYCIGIIIAFHFKQFIYTRYNKKTTLTSLLAIIVIQFIHRILNIPDRCALRIIIYSLYAILLWIVYDFLAIEKEPAWWVKISFISYVSHEMILEPIEKIIFLTLGNNLLGAIIDYIFAPIFTMTIIIFFSYILKNIPILWKILSGNRRN